ncbi:hypothetical protein SAMN06265380_102401 [Ruegeria faecimaris]|uniref:Uncharacterized protein n=3 Tax=Ruegeria faecimaris TaxID=686389 RepID=A0A521CFD8_9RHOB|nr:hypothetical protein SAMN06265380_102401 [Ruegeria faecimaris]
MISQGNLFCPGSSIMKYLISTCALTLMMVPAMAQAVGFGVGINPAFRTTVTPRDNGVYEVATSGSSAPVAYWCGIGDFAIRTLRTKSNQRIYITRAYDKQTRTVQFSLTAPEGVDTTPGYSVTVKRVGENMSAASAQRYCSDNFMDFGF